MRSSLHAVPLMTVYPTGFSATALGIARGFLDAFMVLAREKKPRGHARPLCESPVVQDEVARAEARLTAARGFVLSAADDGWREIVSDGRMSVEKRIRIRLAPAFSHFQDFPGRELHPSLTHEGGRAE